MCSSTNLQKTRYSLENKKGTVYNLNLPHLPCPRPQGNRVQPPLLSHISQGCSAPRNTGSQAPHGSWGCFLFSAQGCTRFCRAPLIQDCWASQALTWTWSGRCANACDLPFYRAYRAAIRPLVSTVVWPGWQRALPWSSAVRRLWGRIQLTLLKFKHIKCQAWQDKKMLFWWQISRSQEAQ